MAAPVHFVRPSYPNRDHRIRKNEPQHNINERIKARQVRVVGEGIEQGVYPTEKAIQMAKQMGFDLVEIASNVDPPVCKIIDYKKFLYEQKRKQKEIKAKTAKVVVKEIRFGPHTEEHDFNFKKNHALSFLQHGAKVRAYVFFKGRTILFKEQGELLLLKFAQELEEYGKVEQLPVMDGKKMTMLLSPKKK